MSRTETLTVDREELRAAWTRTLPTVLNQSDRFEVHPGEDDQTLRVHIASAGHSMYSFDFSVSYVDSREVRVELIDVEKGDDSVDERNETIQQLVEDYVRHLHECAQALHSLTHK